MAQKQQTDTPASFYNAEDELYWHARHSTVEDTRAFFDRMILTGQQVSADGDCLLAALNRQDPALVKLMVTWGATVSQDELFNLKMNQKEAEYINSLKMLRRCGIRHNIAIPEMAHGFNQAAHMRDIRLGALRTEWLMVLSSTQKLEADAVIAGGALRDTCHGKPVKDVDIFVASRGSTAKNRELIAAAFSSAGVGIADDKNGVLGNTKPKTGGFNLSETDYGLAGVPTESWYFASKTGTDYNFIFIDRDNLQRHSKSGAQGFMAQVVSLFDVGLCQIYTDGATLGMTANYNKDSSEKKITLLKENKTSGDHLMRLSKKYPDFKLSPDAERVLKSEKNKLSLSVYDRDGWHSI